MNSLVVAANARVARAREDERGTLMLDTLVAMAILAIVFAVAYPNYAYARSQSQVATSAQQLQNIASALEMYANDNGGYYPGQTDPGATLPGDGGTTVKPSLFGTASTEPYFSSSPNAPFSSKPYVYAPDGGQAAGTQKTYLLTDPSTYPTTLLGGYRKADGTVCGTGCTTLNYDSAHGVYGS